MTEQEPAGDPGTDIQLIKDDRGIAVIGSPDLVQSFLDKTGLSATGHPSRPLRSGASTMSGILNVGSEISANSGRWLPLTKESAALVKRAPLVTNSTTGNLHATVRASNGQFLKNLEFVRTPTSLLTNPAALSNAAALMTQLAMSQMMDEITDYLKTIDKKLDDVLQSFNDSVLSQLYGVSDVIDDAMAVRESVGSVSETTWSKVHTASMTIASTRNYALRRLTALADALDDTSDLGDLVSSAKAIETSVQDWLTVLVNCIQLQEAVDILELDRVMGASPDDLNKHRIGLETARSQRWDRMGDSLNHLLTRMDGALSRANESVLFRPLPPRRILRSTDLVTEHVVEFQEQLGLESHRDHHEARKWRSAVGDVKDNAVGFAADTSVRFKRSFAAFREPVANPSGERSEDTAEG
ncbi:hypothetical protein ACT3SZ_15895 [Corynebacterium sp. AOP40-9SA-29]|uniref:hypothetical protein n=1 Tax=Corynebacterium sp. AOP40-9SA-29 TaxID=3457677 RepID=UPI004033BAF9